MTCINRKAKGSRRERQTIAILESLGYSCTKSGGSLGIWDIIAIGPNDIRLVQVKSNRRPGRKEMECMAKFRCPPCASKELWIWYDRKPDPVIVIIEQPRE